MRIPPWELTEQERTGHKDRQTQTKMWQNPARLRTLSWKGKYRHCGPSEPRTVRPMCETPAVQHARKTAAGQVIGVCRKHPRLRADNILRESWSLHRHPVARKIDYTAHSDRPLWSNSLDNQRDAPLNPFWSKEVWMPAGLPLAEITPKDNLKREMTCPTRRTRNGC